MTAWAAGATGFPRFRSPFSLLLFYFLSSLHHQSYSSFFICHYFLQLDYQAALLVRACSESPRQICLQVCFLTTRISGDRFDRQPVNPKSRASNVYPHYLSPHHPSPAHPCTNLGSTQEPQIDTRQTIRHTTIRQHDTYQISPVRLVLPAILTSYFL